MNFKYYKSHRLILFIIGLSIVVGSFVTLWIHPAIEKTPEPIRTLIIYLELFTVPFFILLIFLYIDQWGWKTKCFKWLVDLPNLNGRYRGKLVSSFKVDNKNVEIECAVEIKQTASEITISAYYFNAIKNEYSKSDSVIELIEKQRNGSFLIYYVYTNTPGTLHPSLNIHEGTTVCTYYPDKKMLVGEYYNSRPNTGRFEVQFKSDKLIYRFE